MGLYLDGRISAGNDLLDTDLRDIHIISGAEGSFLYAATGQNGGISVYYLDGSGWLADLSDSRYFSSSGISMGPFDVVDIDGAVQLIFGGTGNGALISYRVETDGDLSGLTQNDLPGNGAETARAVATSALAGGISALYMVNGDSGALLAFVSDGAGALTGTGVLNGVASAFNFSGGALLETAQAGGNSYLLAGDGGSNSVRSYLIDATSGALSHSDSLGAWDGLGIAAPSAMEVITAHGVTWVVLAASGSGSLSVMRLAPDGQLSPADHVLDTLATRFGGVAALEVIGVGDHAFVLAGGADDGLSLFSLLPGGQLVHMQSLAHSAGAGLENITGIEAVQVGDEVKIFVTSGSAPGVSQFSLPLGDLGSVIEAPGGAQVQGTGADDLILGRGALDQLMGQGGDDILVASEAGGELTGGAGADIFVLCPTGGNLVIGDFQPGQDRLDLSHFPMLRSLSQLDFTATGTGIEISYADTTIQVHSHDGQTLLPADLWPDGFDTPDRVPIPPGPVIRFINGTMGADSFDFGTGLDRIWGLGGNDVISSGAGKDRLYGGAGSDTLKGGSGKDTLVGGNGADTLRGGDGQDTLDGSNGNDWLWGGKNADTITGGAGKDVLKGEKGADTLDGGADADTLFGGPGPDTLTGGTGADMFYGGPGADTLFGDVGADTLFGGTGADTLTGGTGADRFIFATGHGADRINDFIPGEDRIRINIADTGFGDLTLTAQGDDTLIDTGAGTITLSGLLPDALSSGDFLFP